MSPGGIDVGTGGQAHAADHDGRQVGQYVSEEIAGDNNIEGFGSTDKFHHGAINQQRLRLDSRKIGSDLLEDLVPQHHAISLGVALGD